MVKVDYDFPTPNRPEQQPLKKRHSPDFGGRPLTVNVPEGPNGARRPTTIKEPTTPKPTTIHIPQDGSVLFPPRY